MKSLLLFASLFASTCYTSLVCRTCIDGRCYDRNKIYLNSQVTLYHFAIVRSKNILHFSGVYEIGIHSTFEFHGRGTYTYDLDNGTQRNISTNNNNYIIKYAVDHETDDIYAIYRSENGVYKYDRNTNVFKPYALAEEKISNIYYKNKIYYTLFSCKGLYEYDDNRSLSIHDLNNYNISTFILDKQDNIYFNVYDLTAVYRLKRDAKEPTVYVSGDFSLLSDNTGALIFLKDSHRVYRLNNYTDSLDLIGVIDNNNRASYYNHVFDRDNNIVYQLFPLSPTIYSKRSTRQCSVNVTQDDKISITIASVNETDNVTASHSVPDSRNVTEANSMTKPHSDCMACIDGYCYYIKQINFNFTGVHYAYAIEGSKNILHFSGYSHENKTVAEGYYTYDLGNDTQRYMSRNNIKQYAIDEETSTIYASLYYKTGIYIYNSNTSMFEMLIQLQNFTGCVYYKDKIYYTLRSEKGLYAYAGNKSSPIQALNNSQIYEFIVDKKDDIYFRPGGPYDAIIYRLKRDAEEPTVFVIGYYQFFTDYTDSLIFIGSGSKEKVYRLNYDTDSLELIDVSKIRNNINYAMDRNNNIIFKRYPYGRLYHLKRSTVQCRINDTHKQMSIVVVPEPGNMAEENNVTKAHGVLEPGNVTEADDVTKVHSISEPGNFITADSVTNAHSVTE